MSARPAKPCGTPAAYRRHYRHSEIPDEACRSAGNRDKSQRQAAREGREYDPYAENTPPPDPAPRNGLPIVAYEYRARDYPWARIALERAEAMYGKPEPDAGWEAA